ncbi:nucleotidyltransferase domain-containing protein [Sphingobacterium mizutaii]|uniref:nucleotidyltransferase domain-containing protein n=1 Tax=Sphingobacterium mizutaii TaxID=1010 RepID=UPI0016270667|nr:nucleotidyltransferase domain-containing protein [Sphingobacterium mizutaii]
MGMNLLAEKQKIFDAICEDLEKVEHVSAVVLGGSYATGRANADSDIDIGIYYHENNPFDIKEIESIAKKYAKDNIPTVTDFYEWGPWVNGGAWIQTEAGKIDFLYRNINQVRRTIQDAMEGIWENHYEQQPPYGFTSLFYLAEIEACKAVFDPQNVIQYLKSLVKIYPEPLKNKIIQESLWAAEFSIINTNGFAKSNDYYNTFCCFTRTLKAIVQALFAINEIYPISDKKALEILEKADQKPKDLTKKVESILKAKGSLTDSLMQLNSLFQEVVQLSGNQYTPLFSFKNGL